MNDNRKETPEVWYKRGIEARKAKNYSQAFQYFFKAAAQGHSESQRWLGLMYWSGEGVGKNYTEAFKWANRAAAQGNIAAATNVGYFYRNGIGVPKNDAEAVKWYAKAAANGDRVGQFNYGYMHYYGYGVKQDYNKAIQWFLQAANQNNYDAFYYIGHMYEKGYGVPKNLIEAKNWFLKGATHGHKVCTESLERINNGPASLASKGEAAHNAKNYAEAYDCFLKAAIEGNAYAQCMLGYYYDNGYGVSVDKTAAAQWYLEAAKNGHSYAQNRIGEYYKHGLAGFKNKKEAVKCFKKEAAQGYKGSYSHLGRAYEFGNGVGKSYEEAAKWYKKAAEDGKEASKNSLEEVQRYIAAFPKYKAGCEAWKVKNYTKAISLFNEVFLLPEAKAMLGQCYQFGLGTDKDLHKAFDCYESAARCEIPEAQYHLACFYFNGTYVDKNYERALHWFWEAVKHNIKASSPYLGYLYEHGLGIDKNLKKAYHWYKKGANAGFEYCKKALDRLEVCAEDYYQNGMVQEDDGNFEEAEPWYRKAAEMGHADAACGLALIYDNGLDVPASHKIATQWYHNAAALGDYFAQNEVGDMCYKKKKYMQAVDWYEKSAKQGYDTALFNLAWCFHHGGIAPADSVECNYSEAIRIYKECETKTTDKNFKNKCRFQIGQCYELGLNNSLEARKWYQMGYREQYAPAMTALKQLNMVESDRSGAETWFKKGEQAFWNITVEILSGMKYTCYSPSWNPTRYCEAMRWWTKAAFNGHTGAQYNLARYIYQQGHGAPMSQAEALKWFTAAAKRGHRHSQAVLVNKYKYGYGAIKDLQESERWQRILNQNN